MEARIVVVDSDDSIRELLTFCLEREGCQVWSYAYGHIDLEGLEQLKPDLIILDFNLQDAAIGWDFLQLLKMEAVTAKIPILITTKAFQLSLEVRGYLLTHYISVLQIPFDLVTFSAMVQTTLSLAHRAGDLFSSLLPLPVLVVDDSAEMRETITTVLGFENYQSVTAKNGLLALEAISRIDYCLILLDISMPVMNGFEFLQAYERQLRPHTPVIILSSDNDVRAHRLPSFVVDVITKPFEMKHLLSRVQNYAQPV